MLASSFMRAAHLGVREHQREAAIRVLGMMERGELVHAPEVGLSVEKEAVHGHVLAGFNMARFFAVGECGTTCCIGGAVELMGGAGIMLIKNEALDDLFLMTSIIGEREEKEIRNLMTSVTVEQGAAALRNWLTTGHARWREVLG